MVEVIQTNTHCHTSGRSSDHDDMDIHDTSTTHAAFSSEWLRPGSPSMAEGAKKHLEDVYRKKRRGLFFLSCVSSARKARSRRKSEPSPVVKAVDMNQIEGEPQAVDHDPLDIEFSDEGTYNRSNYTSDQFRWAVLYENQRGFVLFSTPYYSSRSLLPRLDPPAYTFPDTQLSTASSRRVSRKVTLKDYPLPDPTWRWISKSWFVDMRGDGEVQHDGFEYNWCFRKREWRSKVGWFSAGGFVRRRRWVRLMVRPSDGHLQAEATERQRNLEDNPMESLIPIYQPSESPLWRGDEYDWQRLRKVLKIIAMDGPKLELWRAWLTDIITEREPRKGKFPEALANNPVAAINENSQLMDERPSQEWILSILSNHAKDLRHIFVFPESRSQFGELLLKAGLLQALLPDAPDDATRIATVLVCTSSHIINLFRSEIIKDREKFGKGIVAFREKIDFYDWHYMNWSFNVSSNRRFFMYSVPRSPSTPLIQRLVPQKRPFHCRSVTKYLLENSYPKKLTRTELKMYSTQALARKPTSSQKKGRGATAWSSMESIPSYEFQESEVALEAISEDFHDLAYIASLYYPGDAYVTQKNIDNPKNLVWGTFYNEMTIRQISFNKNGMSYHRCILYLRNSSIIAVGDSLTKSEAEHMAALSAYFQLVRRGAVPVPRSSEKLESRLPAFLKSRAPSVIDPESFILLADKSEVTYERARAFMGYYCDRFRLGRADISFEPMDVKGGNSWQAVITVTGRRIGIGLGSTKKNAQVAAYFDVVRYLDGCDADLWPAFLEAEKNGIDLGFAPKVPFNLSRTLHNDMDALCRDIRNSSLYRNRSQPDNEASSQGPHVPTTKYHTRPVRPARYYNAKSEILRNRLTTYQTDPSFASIRSQRESLPVTKQSQSILSQIATNDVTICMAATGSGKTTQIPQLILDEAIELGEGARCNVICTQPRRIAAISVAHRVANERGETLGSRSSIGYQARFESKPPDDNGSITFCTTGVLLKRLQNYFSSSEGEGYRNLDNVTHIVVDEVHERDVDTDLLLVVLKRFLEHRRNRDKPLKILLMSATIDPTLFQEYFRDSQGQRAPVIEVPGRSFPVTKYFLDDTIQDLKKDKIAQWVFKELSVTKFLAREFGNEVDKDSERDDVLEIPYPLVALTIAHVLQKSDSGHVLVFLPGWEDITNVQRLLLNTSRPLGLNFNDTTCYSIHLLHSTIPLQEQQVIFEPPAPGVRRIILATNIAETSITIPDVVYVVDTAKIKENRYDPQRYMSYLVTAWVGSSNLNQRAGRAGRHRPGEYFGILSKTRADLLSPYQMVEMKRADLSNVVMHIKALNFPSLGLHEVLAAAIEPPDPDRVVMAVHQLQQIGAIDVNENLTPLGKILLQLPVDVQLGRLLLYGAFFRCLDKALALAAILQNRDPFLSPPLLRKEALTVKHSWSPPGVKSDVLATLFAYEAWAKLGSQGDYNQANRFCIQNFLSKSALHAIDRLKGHLLQALYNAGIIDVSAGGELVNVATNRTYIPFQLTTNSQSIPLLSALVTFALQPKYAVQSSGKIFRTAKDKMTIVHSSSINSSRLNDPEDESFQNRQIMAFTEQRQTVTTKNSTNPAPFLVGTSQIDSLHYILFGAYHLQATRQGLECDGWVPIVGPQEALESILQVRLLTDQCMLRVYEGINHSARKQQGTFSNTSSRGGSQESLDESIYGKDELDQARLSTTEMQELDFLTRDLIRILDKFNSEKAGSLPKGRSLRPLSEGFPLELGRKSLLLFGDYLNLRKTLSS